MERIFGIFGKAWVLYNFRSFDSWGGCRTPNFGSPSSCLHVYMAWLRGLVLSAHGMVDVSAVRRGCKISWCATSPSGHATIVIKFTYAPPWRLGHASCSRVFHIRTHITNSYEKNKTTRQGKLSKNGYSKRNTESTRTKRKRLTAGGGLLAENSETVSGTTLAPFNIF